MPRTKEKVVEDIVKVLTMKQKLIADIKRELKGMTERFDTVNIALIRNIEARFKEGNKNLLSFKKLLEDI